MAENLTRKGWDLKEITETTYLETLCDLWTVISTYVPEESRDEPDVARLIKLVEGG